MTSPDDAAAPSIGALGDAKRVAAAERVVAGGPAGPRLDMLVTLAANVLDVPFAQLSLLTGTEQVVAAAHGLDLDTLRRRMPLEDSLCTVAAAAGEPLIIADARCHPWVENLPPVTSGSVVAYLGVTVADPDGHILGSLCAYDIRVRHWSPEQVDQLQHVATLVSLEITNHTATADLHAAGVRARLALDAAELGSFVYHFGTTGLLDWDARMLALHGHTAETFGGSLADFERTVHPEDLPGVMQRFAHARDTLGDMVAEYRVAAPDGGFRWVRLRGRVMPDMLGEASHILGAAYDASAERGLRDELLRLMERMPVALVRISHDWTITYVNVIAEGLLGGSREQFVGTQLWEAFPGGRGTAFETHYAAAIATGEPDMIEAYFAPMNAHFEVRIWPDSDGLTLFFHDISESKRAQLGLERSSARLAIIADAGARLAASVQPQDVLDILVGLVVPDLAVSAVVTVTDTVAEFLGICAGNDATKLHVVRARHVDAAEEEHLLEAARALDLRTTGASGLGHVARTGDPQWLDVVPENEGLTTDPVAADTGWPVAGPRLTVALRAPGRTLGTVTVTGDGDHPLDEVLLADIAIRASVALDNTLTFARQHRAATALQRALLPRTARAVPGVLVATRYLPANASALAGGDFFKTVDVGGTIVCALGDVMGHGTASAARAGQLHGLVAALALQGLGPAELLTRLGADIDQMMDLELATLLVCRYDPATRLLTAATAGHPAPLLAPVAGDPFYVELEPGPPIGVAAAEYGDVTVELERASTMVLFSDGLIERRSESITVGLERLRRAVAELRMPPEAVADHILRSLSAAHGGDDDIALLVLTHL